MWILISWLLIKPVDLDLHCFKRGCRILMKMCIQLGYYVECGILLAHLSQRLNWPHPRDQKFPLAYNGNNFKNLLL